MWATPGPDCSRYDRFSRPSAAYVNLTNRIRPPRTARFRNPYREWIGAQIRGDVFGYVHPGDPWAAARLAFQDASLSHTGNGVYGEMWSAGLVSAAFTAPNARAAVDVSLGVIPPHSRFAEAIGHVVRLRDEDLTWAAARQRIEEAYGQYAWVHTINNAALVVLGVL